MGDTAPMTPRAALIAWCVAENRALVAELRSLGVREQTIHDEVDQRIQEQQANIVKMLGERLHEAQD